MHSAIELYVSRLMPQGISARSCCPSRAKLASLVSRARCSHAVGTSSAVSREDPLPPDGPWEESAPGVFIAVSDQKRRPPRVSRGDLGRTESKSLAVVVVCPSRCARQLSVSIEMAWEMLGWSIPEDPAGYERDGHRGRRSKGAAATGTRASAMAVQPGAFAAQRNGSLMRRARHRRRPASLPARSPTCQALIRCSRRPPSSGRCARRNAVAFWAYDPPRLVADPQNPQAGEQPRRRPAPGTGSREQN